MGKSRKALEELNRNLCRDFESRTPASKACYERARQSLTGGVSGSVRYFHPYPLYCESGAGAYITDIDGNRYIDCLLGNGALLLGHQPEQIIAARQKHADRSALLFNPQLAIELAEQLTKMVPGAERVRLVNSGTEAVLTALRFARAHTGRSVVLKFFGAYHGMDDQVLVGLDARNRPASAGIPEEAYEQTALVPLTDPDAVEARLSRGDVAAVLIDPTMHQSGMWAGEAHQYQRLKEMTNRFGALLIFDEVISGFRLAPGGAQEYFGVTPDLCTFAKALGVGEKLGAIAGRADVMNVADPSADRSPGPFAFQSGTCNDSTLTLATALAAVSRYRELEEEGAYQALDRLAATLGRGLREAFREKGIPCHYNQLGPMLRLFLCDGPLDYEHCATANRRALNLFHLGLVNEGVLTIPGVNDFFISFAHTSSDIEEVLAASRRVLDNYDFSSAIE